MPGLDTRTAVVTGANRGLGLAAAKALAAHGAHVILACRNPQRAAAAVAACREVATGPLPEARTVDLADLESIAAFAAALTVDLDRIDILLNNAGVMATPRMLTGDGFEMQLGTNHLGPFALTGRLLPRLASDGRVVTVASLTANVGSIRFDDLQGERAYHPMGAYSQSKLANLLFTAELDRRLRAAGSTVRAVAAHPGYVHTNLGHGPGHGGLGDLIMDAGNALVAQSVRTGSLPALYAATETDVEGGDYYGPRGPFHLWGKPRRIGYPRPARRDGDARRLWNVSENLTGVSFDLAPAE